MIVTNADNPYPTLPGNLNVRRIEDGVDQSATRSGNGAKSMTTVGCRSVTVAWTLAADAPVQRYCVYATEVTPTMNDALQLDACADPRRRSGVGPVKSKKIACKVVSKSTSQVSSEDGTIKHRYGAIGVEVGGGGGDGGGGGGGGRGTVEEVNVNGGNTTSIRGESTMVQTVGGLKPGRRYMFDVHATRESDDGDEATTGVGRHFRFYDRLVASPTSSGC